MSHHPLPTVAVEQVLHMAIRLATTAADSRREAMREQGTGGEPYQRLLRAYGRQLKVLVRLARALERGGRS